MTTQNLEMDVKLIEDSTTFMHYTPLQDLMEIM